MALDRAKPGQPVTLNPAAGPLTMQTAALVKSEHFTAIHLMVPEGREISEHVVDGPITLFCLEGTVEIGLPQARPSLSQGEWLFLEGGTPHSVYGTKASRLLLTIMMIPSGTTI